MIINGVGEIPGEKEKDLSSDTLQSNMWRSLKPSYRITLDTSQEWFCQKLNLICHQYLEIFYHPDVHTEFKIKHQKLTSPLTMIYTSQEKVNFQDSVDVTKYP